MYDVTRLMYICTACNRLVPDPVNRKCPAGHPLWDLHLIGYTREQSFRASLFYTMIACLGILGVVAAIGAVVPKLQTPFVFVALISFAIAGILALFRGMKWRRQGGDVTRLVPRANGMALAAIMAGPGLFVLVVLLNLR
jgi:hypothetical protein